MSALSRVMLAIALGIKPDPADAEEFGELFDRTPLYGLDVPFLTDQGRCADNCDRDHAPCTRRRWTER